MYPELNYEDFAVWYQFQDRRSDDLAGRCRAFSASDAIRYARIVPLIVGAPRVRHILLAFLGT